MKKNIATSGINGFKPERLFAILLFAWLCINILQALLTEVMTDETYYYMYGETPAWGYFDHPPAVGIMAWLSGLLFGGNLSVRFITVILQVFTILTVWKIIGEKSPDTRKTLLFFLIAASFVMFQTYGFVTTPDPPFLFFTALFLYAYRQFLNEESWRNTAFLTLSMAGMVYSKYHAVLIVGFILLSNLRLLTRPKCWIAALGTLLLLAPHLYWQVANDFPSFQYHLSGRSRAFRWSDFLKYLPNQLVVFNPFTFGAVVYVLAKYRPSDRFERGLYFLITGFFVFFWLTTFRGEVEPHWTVATSIPMMILLYRHCLDDRRLMRYARRVIAPSLLLILLARIVLTTDLLPARLKFSGKEEACRRIESIAGDRPVVFTGSFQSPSEYHFFTGKESFVLSSVTGRQTQYDLLAKELNFQGKPAFICMERSRLSQKYTVDGYPVYGYFVESLQTVNRQKIHFTLPRATLSPGDTLQIPFEIHNPSDRAIDFLHPELPVALRAVYIPRRTEASFADCELSEPLASLPPRSTVGGYLKTVVPPLEQGEYRFSLTLENPVCAARNAAYQSVSIRR
ncbi:MAG: glycosyltransferase family 39 protein [Tannerellaceae bacterium]|jgi:hypothetical protein|nr:glycosyltransferase family 39 protein [Tannerellaceae bacterium]